MRMAKDPAVSSVECDCYIRADMSLPESDDSSPGTHDQVKAVGMYQVEAVARRLSVHVGAPSAPIPWGLDRIDTNGRPTDGKYDDGDLTGKGVRVYIVDTGVQGSHVDFGGRVVNGHTVRAAPHSRRPRTPTPTSYNTTRPSTPPHPPPLPTASYPRHSSSCSPRSPASTPSATRAKLSTASSPPTALDAPGTAPTWPRPSVASSTASPRM